MNDKYSVGGKWLEDLNNDLEGSDRAQSVWGQGKNYRREMSGNFTLTPNMIH